MMAWIDFLRVLLALPFVYLADVIDHEAVSVYESGDYARGERLAVCAARWARFGYFIAGVNRGNSRNN